MIVVNLDFNGSKQLKEKVLSAICFYFNNCNIYDEGIAFATIQNEQIIFGLPLSLLAD
jgi:hypothetical protein